MIPISALIYSHGRLLSNNVNFPLIEQNSILCAAYMSLRIIHKYLFKITLNQLKTKNKRQIIADTVGK